MTDPRPEHEGPQEPPKSEGPATEPLPSQARPEWITYVERDANLDDEGGN